MWDVIMRISGSTYRRSWGQIWIATVYVYVTRFDIVTPMYGQAKQRHSKIEYIRGVLADSM